MKYDFGQRFGCRNSGSLKWGYGERDVVPSLNFSVRAFTQPRDGVVVQTPVYFPFFPAVEKNGRRFFRSSLRYENGRWTMDFDDLARKRDDITLDYRAGAGPGNNKER